jgi:flagellar biosynthetic protein FlhB
MPDKPATERTEQPTPKRLTDARSKGQAPQSEEMMSFASILVLVAMIAFLGQGLVNWFTTLIRQGISSQTSVFANSQVFMNFINMKIIDFILVLCPIFAALCAGSVLAGFVVSGLNFAPKAINLKLSAINPTLGFSNLVNARSMVRFLASVLKLFFVSLIAWSYLHDKTEILATIRWAWSMQILVVTAKLILGLMIRVCIALLVIAAADTFYQKWKFIHDLMMTRQEVKEERKQTEGSPEVKSRIRRIQFQMALKRVLQEVPKASVVLVNPTHVAVALRYESKTMEAPVLVAKGADHLAEKIREIARAYGVPVIRRPELARTIYSTVEPGHLIPESLYVAVAEVLALLYRLRHRK